MTKEYNGTVDEIPYTEAQAELNREADILMALANDLLEKKYAEKGDGWQWEDPRFHYWKGMDEFFSANHAWKERDLNRMRKHNAHGWNHILMATYIAHVEIIEADLQTQSEGDGRGD